LTYVEFHIKSSVNIFWLDFLKEENLKKYQKIKKYLSSQAMTLLKLLDYNVTSIKYGYGILSVVGVQISGWLNFNYPVV